jgi:hypothetical protein
LGGSVTSGWPPPSVSGPPRPLPRPPRDPRPRAPRSRAPSRLGGRVRGVPRLRRRTELVLVYAVRRRSATYKGHELLVAQESHLHLSLSYGRTPCRPGPSRPPVPVTAAARCLSTPSEHANRALGEPQVLSPPLPTDSGRHLAGIRQGRRRSASGDSIAGFPFFQGVFREPGTDL